MPAHRCQHDVPVGGPESNVHAIRQEYEQIEKGNEYPDTRSLNIFLRLRNKGRLTTWVAQVLILSRVTPAMSLQAWIAISGSRMAPSPPTSVSKNWSRKIHTE